MQGFVYIHRKIIYSDIYMMPPLYLRVFERLVLEANHKDNVIPNKGTKKLIKRGERLTSIAQIAEWVAWYERGVLKIPNKKTISDILDWLISNGLIEIHDKGNAKGTHYNIVNYSVYQTYQCDESNAIEMDIENDEANKSNSNLLGNESNAKVTVCNPVISTKNENDFSPKYRSLDTNNNVNNNNNFIDDNGIRQIQLVFENNGFGTISPIILDDINDLLDNHHVEPGMIIEALKAAKKHNVTTWIYASRIILRALEKGIRTLEAFKAEQIRYENEKLASKNQPKPYHNGKIPIQHLIDYSK